MGLRILHISDLHARCDWSGDQRLIATAMVRDVHQLHAQAPIDVIIFSGDLAHSGKLAEYEVAKEVVIDPLRTLLDVDDTRVVLVPGNHDVDRSTIDTITEAGLRGVLIDRDAVTKLFTNGAQLDAATARLSTFDSFAAQFCAPTPPSQALHRTCVCDIHGTKVGIAALNSAWRSSGDDDKLHLLLGEPQLRTALAAVDDCDVRLVVMHHPLDWLAAFDANIARRQFEFSDSLTVVFSGHDHVAEPTYEASWRGRAVYSRAGCLYETFEYHNGYSVLDIDPRDMTVVVHLRAWYPQREEFDANVAVAPDGLLPLDLPRNSSLSVAPPPYTQVVASLVDLVQETSIVADALPTIQAASVDELLVPPRLLPLPYSELVAAGMLKRDARSRPIDVGELVGDAGVVCVAGEPESGVSSSLIWLLHRSFERDAGRIPVYVKFEPNFKAKRFERMIRAAAGEAGWQLTRDSLPPLALAVDDVVTSSSGSLGALAKWIASRPDDKIFVGCRVDALAEIVAALTNRGLAHRTAFIGPFGRRQLRELVAKQYPEMGGDMVAQVFSVIADQQLPRSPFIMAALVAVLSSNTDTTSVNVSALLDSYVGLLLGRDEPGDPEGLGMDYRRREHLLAWLATVLIRKDVPSLPRMDAENEVIEYFRRKGWGAQISTSRVVDSLVSRRVLLDSDGTLGFRHPALGALFAAKAMREDEEFRREVLATPLDFKEVVAHAAGFSRSDRQLLEIAGSAARSAIDAVADELTVDMFDAISDSPGWLPENRTFDPLKRTLQARAKTFENDDDDGDDDEDVDDDDFREFLEEMVAQSAPSEPSLPPEFDHLFEGTHLLSTVLKSSELVDDVDAKAELLKRSLHAWSLIAVLMAVREEVSSPIRATIRDFFEPENADDEDDLATLDRMSEIVTIMAVSVTASGVVGSKHLQAVIDRALDDQEFMGSTAHALFATNLAVFLTLPGWVDRLRWLHETYRHHPVVARLAHAAAESQYLNNAAVGRSDLSKLETLIADMYMPQTGGGRAAPLVRAQRKDRFLTELRKLRKTRTPEALQGVSSVLAEYEYEKGLDEAERE